MAIANRASVLDNQNAFWSTSPSVRPIRSFLEAFQLSFPHSCFFTFFVFYVI